MKRLIYTGDKLAFLLARFGICNSHYGPKEIPNGDEARSYNISLMRPIVISLARFVWCVSVSVMSTDSRLKLYAREVLMNLGE